MFQPELITLTKRQAAGGVRSSDGSGFGCSESKLGEKKVGESIISDKDSEYMLNPLQLFIGKPLVSYELPAVSYEQFLIGVFAHGS